MKRFLVLLFVVSLVWAAGGCAKKKLVPISAEDNPAHHYLMGMDLIEKGDWSEASVRFDRAIALEQDYAPAMAGLALVSALKAETGKDREHQAVDLERALEMLDDAEDEADGDSQEFSVRVTGIRVYMNARPKKWLKKAEKQYKKALKLSEVKTEELPYYRSIDAAHYFMGAAYFSALQFQNAENALGKVLGSTPGKWHDKANALYKRIQKIIRASANFTLTGVAKKIAVKNEVSRADVAALLVDELHLDRLLAGRIPVPEKKEKNPFVPADIQNNLFKPEILIALKWGLRGLEPTYDQTSRAYLFYPNKPVTRKELAFILEDVLMKITGEKDLATRYFGQKNSPYPDVPTTSSYFNAVMNVVSRGLMEPDLSGAFRPDAYVDGAELLLAVMRLRNVMNIH
jgi:tetratricopeptide (TPR) repeat protein